MPKGDAKGTKKVNASDGEGSTIENQQKVVEILNEIQVKASEPLKSGLDVEFEAFKDRIIVMSSTAKNVSKV
jgi:hypothetical protein